MNLAHCKKIAALQRVLKYAQFHGKFRESLSNSEISGLHTDT